MPRIDGVQPAAADVDITSEYQRQEARYGAPLFNHMVLARCPAIFRGFRAMWTGIEGSGRLAPALISLINTQVARLVGCGL